MKAATSRGLLCICENFADGSFTALLQAQLRQMNPELPHEELVSRTRAAILQLQNLHRVQTPVILNENTMTVGQRNTTGYDQSYYQAVSKTVYRSTS